MWRIRFTSKKERDRLVVVFLLVVVFTILLTYGILEPEYVYYYRSRNAAVRGVSEETQTMSEYRFHEDLREVRELEAGRWKITFSRIRPESVGTHHQLAPGSVVSDTGLQVVALRPGQLGRLQTQVEMAGLSEEKRTENFQEKEVFEKPKLPTVGEYEDETRGGTDMEQKDAEVPTSNTNGDVGESVATPQPESPAQVIQVNAPQSMKQLRSHWRRELENLKFSLSTRKNDIQRQQISNKTLSLDHTQEQRPDFTVKSYFSFPLPQYTNPLSTILQSEWVHSLKEYLVTLETGSKQISVVTANWEHEVVLLNWLISAFLVASPPVENVLVLSLSRKLHEMLKSKNIPVIFIDPTTIIRSSATHFIRTAFSQVHVVRLSLFRLLNHWGYDVVMYDSDAIPLKNPQPLFNKYPTASLIGSAGKGPETIMSVWGRTICTGVLLLRSSSVMELYWEKMSQVSRYPFTDQGLVNIALRSLGVHWDRAHPVRFTDDMQGQCDNHLKAVILTEEVICRYTCTEGKRSQYYVWHKPAIKRERTVEKKMERAQDGHAWFLRTDWFSRSNDLAGKEWLKHISNTLVNS